MSGRRADVKTIFISSSIEGLVDCRGVVKKHFEDSSQWDPKYIDSEISGWDNGKTDVKDICLANVALSEWYFLIIDKRYGNPIYDFENVFNNISLTECEFFQALTSGKRIIVFIRDEVWYTYNVWTTNLDINFDFDNKYQCPTLLMKLIQKVKKMRFCSRFKTAMDIPKKLNRMDFGTNESQGVTTLREEKILEGVHD